MLVLRSLTSSLFSEPYLISELGELEDFFSQYVVTHVLLETTFTTDSYKKVNLELSIQQSATNRVDSDAQLKATVIDLSPKINL